MEKLICEWDGCNDNATYSTKYKMALCKKHLEEHEEELYWEDFYRRNKIGAYVGLKEKKKS